MTFVKYRLADNTVVSSLVEALASKQSYKQFFVEESARDAIFPKAPTFEELEYRKEVQDRLQEKHEAWAKANPEAHAQVLADLATD